MIETEMNMHKFWENIMDDSGNEIMARGKDYFDRGKVYDLEYEEVDDSDKYMNYTMLVITGKVKGQAIYDAELTE